MITYQTLDGISLKMIYETFLEVFCDYQVNINMSYDDFLNILLKNGYCDYLSMGAFQHEQLIGFMLNGLRLWEGKKTVYDMGTGVIPCMRKKGITSHMFSELKNIFRSHCIHQYLLEVIQTNQEAFYLYQKLGFQVTRELKCYRIEKESFRFIDNNDWEYKEELNFHEVQQLWNCNPSWQNSCESIKAMKENYHYISLYKDHQMIAYGIIHKISGDIPQFAVISQYRHQGIGRELLSCLIQKTSSSMIQVLNVEDQETQLFLEHLGFDHFVDQYEMLLQMEEDYE